VSAIKSRTRHEWDSSRRQFGSWSASQKQFWIPASHVHFGITQIYGSFLCICRMRNLSIYVVSTLWEFLRVAPHNNKPSSTKN
jgi:hypothetical protein